MMKKILLAAGLLALAAVAFTQDDDTNAKRLSTLRYGTETEIATLLQTLKTEAASSGEGVLSGEISEALAALADTSRNKTILSGLFSLYGDLARSGLEDRALRAMRDWDTEAADTVLAAVDYLGKAGAAGARDDLEDLIASGESRFQGPALRALGRIGKAGQDAGDIAAYLIDYFETKSPGTDNQTIIVTALGELGSPEGVPFLADLAGDVDERYTLRMTALEALAKIGDPRGLEAITAAVNDDDPNVRSTAMASLGPFSGETVDQAILEGLRDSFWRTRLGACQAAGTRKLAAAIPYLRYRAENDDTPQVKDAALAALGAIGSGEALAALETFFGESKNADRVRIAAAQALLGSDPSRYAAEVIAAFDDARSRKQTTLADGLLRILGQTKAPALEDLARRLLATGNVTDMSYALDIAGNNAFKGMAEDIRPLLENKNQSIVRKVQLTLDKL